MHALVAEEDLKIGPLGLAGRFELPSRAAGAVVFAHGSGSSRLSPRNRRVAGVLHDHGLATLLFDLLTEDEAADRDKVFDIGLLCRRLGDALDVLRQQPAVSGMPIGLFGASTGAAAALRLAAERPGQVAAVVSRGGRPDLAAEHLTRVQAPTMLIVGGRDTDVLGLNQGAMRLLHCHKRLEIVPGATHLFEEPGALEMVARLAGDWFATHLQAPRT
jgi:putative phosphoribosyl transferase